MHKDRQRYLSNGPGVIETSRSGAVAKGKIRVNPDVWFRDSNGQIVRLVDKLGLTAANNYEYLVVGIVTNNPSEPILWQGSKDILEMNSRTGKLSNTVGLNSLSYSRLVSAIQKTLENLMHSRAHIDLLPLVSAYESMIQQRYGSKYTIDVSRGSAVNFVDPFSPIPDDIRTYQDLDDLSNKRLYADVTIRRGSASFTSNTAISISQARDTDSDKMEILLTRLMYGKEEADKLMYAFKAPDTAHNPAYFTRLGQLDTEGELFDPGKKYRRMTGISAGLSLDKLVAQTQTVIEKTSLATWKDRQKLKGMLSAAISSNDIGVFFTKQWTLEAMNFEKILTVIPEFMKQTNKDVTAREIEAALEYLQSPGILGALRYQLNPGPKGERIKSESIIKMMAGDDPLKAMGLNAVVDMQTRLEQAKNNIESFDSEARIKYYMDLANMSPDEQVLSLTGLRPGITFRTTTPVNKRKSSVIKSVINEGKVLTSANTSRDPLLESLIRKQLLNKRTGQMESIFHRQAIDLTEYLEPEQLELIGKLSPEQQRLAKTGYLISMRGLDEDGNLVLKPLSGKHPDGDIRSKAMFVGPVRDAHAGKYIDALDLMSDMLEQEVSREVGGGHLEKYGYGELQGRFSIENLRSKKGIYAILELVDANPGTTLQQIQNLAKKGDTYSVQQLERFKLVYDMAAPGKRSRTAHQDLVNAAQKVVPTFGVDIDVETTAGGRLIPTKPGALKDVTQSNVNIFLGKENLTLEEKDDILTKDSVWLTNKTGGPHMLVGRDTSDVMMRAPRDIVKDGRVAEGMPHRFQKISQVESINLGPVRLAIVDFHMTEKGLERLRPLMAGPGNDNPLLAKGIGEGIGFQTKYGERLIRDKIIGDLRPDEYIESSVRPSDPEYKYKNRTSTGRTIWTKEQLNMQRLIFDKTGGIRVEFEAGGLGKVMADDKEVHLILSLDEAVAKGYMNKAIDTKTKELGGAVEAAWKQVSREGGNENIRSFYTEYKDQLFGSFDAQLKISQHNMTVDNALIIETDDLRIRDNSSDQKAMKLIKGIWDPKTHKYLDEEGNVLDMTFRGKYGQDRAIELGAALQRLGEYAGRTNFDHSEILEGVLLNEFNPGSLKDQLRFDEDETEIIRLARKVYAQNSHLPQSTFETADMIAQTELALQASADKNLMSIVERSGFANEILDWIRIGINRIP